MFFKYFLKRDTGINIKNKANSEIKDSAHNYNRPFFQLPRTSFHKESVSKLVFVHMKMRLTSLKSKKATRKWLI